MPAAACRYAVHAVNLALKVVREGLSSLFFCHRYRLSKHR
jgi:hypothetical protein